MNKDRVGSSFVPARRSKRGNSYGNVSGWVAGWVSRGVWVYPYPRVAYTRPDPHPQVRVGSGRFLTGPVGYVYDVHGYRYTHF